MGGGFGITELRRRRIRERFFCSQRGVRLRIGRGKNQQRQQAEQKDHKEGENQYLVTHNSFLFPGQID